MTDGTGTVEGGVAIKTKSVKWRLNHFPQIFLDQELVRQQWMTFDVTSSKGVTSKWMLNMDFTEKTQDPTTNGPDSSNKTQYLTLFVSLVSTSNGEPYVNAKFDVDFKGKDGLSFYKPSPGGSNWYHAGKFSLWHIDCMRKNEDIGHLLTPEGTVLVKLEATIYDVLGQTADEAGLGQGLTGNLPDMVPMIVHVPTEPHPQFPDDLYSQMAQVSDIVQGRVRALEKEIQRMKGRAEASGAFGVESRALLDYSIDQLASKSMPDLYKEASELQERNRQAISALEKDVAELMKATGCPPVPDTPPNIIDLCSSEDESQGEDEPNLVTLPTPKETETSVTSAPLIVPVALPTSKESETSVTSAPLAIPAPAPTPKESETSVTSAPLAIPAPAPTPKESETSVTSAPLAIPAPAPNSKESESAVIPIPVSLVAPPPTPKESETSVTSVPPVTPTPEKTSATVITPGLATGSGSASASAAPKNRMNRQDLLAYMDMVETCKLAVPATGPESTLAKANADPSPPPVTSTTMTPVTAPTEPVKATSVAPSTAAVNSDRPRAKRPLTKAEEKIIKNPPKLQLTRVSAEAIARLSRPLSQPPPPPGASGAATKRRGTRKRN